MLNVNVLFYIVIQYCNGTVNNSFPISTLRLRDLFWTTFINHESFIFHQIFMGRRSKKEIMRATVGVDEPVRRPDSRHPITEKPDQIRSRIGDRRRIEDVEFNVGYVICGKRLPNGEYCAKEPVDGIHRCDAHRSSENAVVTTSPSSCRHTLSGRVLMRCSVCKDAGCIGFTRDRNSDTCIFEIEMMEELMKGRDKAVEAGVVAASSFDSLVMDTILLSRIFRTLAKDGTMVEELKSYTPFDGELHAVINSVDHPLLKHVPKLQQSVTQLANALEMTPKAMTQKDSANEEGDFKSTLREMYRASITGYRENNKIEDGEQKK